ncbi:MAG: energy transducer TonB [Alphaproteobacteria bacterium]|nr:energy transducer TonB [Alphaproteobacteria bacterium]
MVSLAASAGIVLGIGWALSSGLALTMVQKLNEVIKVEVLPEKLPDKTPPPPPPELKAPPPPFVPAPDIVIMQETAPTNTITTQSKVATVLISSPVSYGRPHTCQQNYPSISQRLGEEGTTQVAFTVTADGTVTNPTVAKSSGSERLDAAALNCVVDWHYHPAIEAGKPVAVGLRANVQWRLK